MKKYLIIIAVIVLGAIFVVYLQNKRRKDRCIGLNDKAVKFIQNNQRDSAIIYFEKAIDIDSTTKRPFQNLISAYLSARKYEYVLSTIKRYVRLPDLSGFDKISVDFVGGIAYYCMGRYDSAAIKWTRYDNYYKMKEKQEHKFDNGFQRIPVLIWLGKNQEDSELCSELKKERPDKSEFIDGILKNPYELLKCRQ